jgi:5,10-methylenetetrahydrofolate reductase
VTLLERLRSPEPLLSVELRPPRTALAHGLTVDAWMGMHRAVRRLMAGDTVLFLTDNAVGTREEENLHHLASNLEEDVSFGRICPFLTTKHTLEYCLWFADRAAARGHEAITVLGGDRSAGPPRCVPHGYLLRQKLRERHPRLALGGWANPLRDAASQVGHLLGKDAAADFYLTQIVSHYDLKPVEAFVREAERRKLALPGVFGVFHYRSANPKTLATLSQFLPVPAEALARDFAQGLTADAICAQTIRALRGLGIPRVYVSNLRPDEAPQRLAAIRSLIGA